MSINFNVLLENDKNYKMLAAWSSNGHFVHAVLIEGQTGSGKKTFALEIAAHILCTGENRPCGECVHCRKVSRLIHPDLHLYEGEGGANSFHVSVVREIRDEAWKSPNDGDRKIFVITNAQNMSVQAQNALLKLIEEPPEGVYFILTCENADQMLSTIRSRTALITMELIDSDNVVKAIRQIDGVHNEADYRAAALRADGNVGRALKFLENADSENEFEVVGEIWENLKAKREFDAAVKCTKFERNKQGLRTMLELLRAIVSEEIRNTGIDAYKYPTSLQLSQIIDIIDETIASIDGNVNQLLLVCVLPSKIVQILEDR